MAYPARAFLNHLGVAEENCMKTFSKSAYYHRLYALGDVCS